MNKILTNKISTISVLRKSKVFIVFVILLIILFTIVLVKTAWITDDAFFTFRTIDNFVNGYGLTWNVTERVEIYSHPLWLFLTAAIHFFTKEFYFTSVILSISISVLAVLVYAFKLSRSLLVALLGIAIFILSNAFIDYSTSGLENPLTHLILAAFLFVFIKSRNNFNYKTLFMLAFIAALGAVNRLDTLLLFLPCLVYVFLKLPKLKGLYITTIGLMPLIAWKSFTLIYYGFPFPNSAYAKVINPGISKEELIQQGVYYFENSLNWDPLTLTVIFSSIAIPFIIKQKHLIPLVIGIALYLIYIIQIGGDFMSGRYFTPPLFIGVVLISQINFNSRNRYLLLGTFSGLVIFLGISAENPSIFSDESYGLKAQTVREIVGEDNGIANERAFYYENTGLFSVLENSGILDHYWIQMGLKWKEEDATVGQKRVSGMYAYYAGPKKHIIDEFSLGDPLLSKLPTQNRENWRIGHFIRSVPLGYFKTIESGNNMLVNKDTAQYYDSLSLITKGELFNLKRFQEIWNMNTGKYDSLLDAYIHSQDYEQTKKGIRNPRDGDTVADTTTINVYSIDDKDPNPVNVCYSIDGVELECELKEAGKVDIHFFWDTTTYSDGNHTIGATSCDSSGKCVTLIPVTVGVDNSRGDISPPAVGIWNPGYLVTVVNTTTISIYSIDDKDPNPVNVCYSIDGVELECGQVSAGQADIHFFWDTTTYSDGSHTIGAISCDSLGNCASASPVLVEVDNSGGDTTPDGWYLETKRER